MHVSPACRAQSADSIRTDFPRSDRHFHSASLLPAVDLEYPAVLPDEAACAFWPGEAQYTCRKSAAVQQSLLLEKGLRSAALRCQSSCFSGLLAEARQLQIIPAADLAVTNNRIGGGNFGDVFQGIYKSWIVVAVKVGSGSSLDFKELNNMLLPLHPNIVEFIGACFEDGQMRLVSRFAGRSLKDCFNDAKLRALLQV